MQLGEELQLMLVSCPQLSSPLGEYAVLVEEDQLLVLKVGGAQYWQWAWSDVLWYCLDRKGAGWNEGWQLEMKIRGWVCLIAMPSFLQTCSLLWCAMCFLHVLQSRRLHLHLGRHLAQTLLLPAP